MGMTCCVVGCRNARGKTPDIQFYSFPSGKKDYKQDLRMRWINAVKRENPDNTPWHPKRSAYICSEHFVGGKKSNIAAHPAYVPTIFPAELNKRKNVTALDPYNRFKGEKDSTFNKSDGGSQISLTY